MNKPHHKCIFTSLIAYKNFSSNYDLRSKLVENNQKNR